MFFNIEKKLKNFTANFFFRLFGLLLLVFLVVPGISYPVSSRMEFEPEKIYKKMNQTSKTEVAAGIWGGTGINLEVKKGGATLEFDCAEAEISEKMMIDKKGNFSVNGKYLRRNPGAIRLKFLPKPQSAKFVGKITGKKMTLKILLAESGEEIGSCQLESGKTVKIRRCY